MGSAFGRPFLATAFGFKSALRSTSFRSASRSHVRIIRKSNPNLLKWRSFEMISNASAIGYALLAAKKMGMSKEELKRFEAIMYGYLDLVTEEEAEEVYRRN
jgi:hypothetical protein